MHGAPLKRRTVDPDQRNRRGSKNEATEREWGRPQVGVEHLVTPHKRRHRQGLLLGSLSQWPENFSMRRVALMLENG